MPRKTARKYKSSKKSSNRSSSRNRSSNRNSNRKTSNRRPKIRMINHGFMKTVTTVNNKIAIHFSNSSVLSSFL